MRLHAGMKTQTTTWLVALGMALLAGTVGAEAAKKAAPAKIGLFRSAVGDLKWAEVSTVVRSPKDICRRVRSHVRYEDDLGDQWESGQGTWDRGYGDCEDFAACVVDLCKATGAEAWIQVFFPANGFEAHAVAMGPLKDGFWISSNGSYETVRSMEDAKQVVAGEVGWRGKSDIISMTPLELKEWRKNLVTASAEKAARAP